MTMPTDFHFREKIPVGVLGATGSVGQMFIYLLKGHPWFDVKEVGASDRSAGKKYRDAVNWIIPGEIPPDVENLEIKTCSPDQFESMLIFSALDSSVAGEIEEAFAKAGAIVLSNAKNHRNDPTVPLLIPEVNHDHLGLLAKQPFGSGKIVTNPNCSAVGLCMALKPLDQLFGIEAVNVVTMQAVSGAGYPGVPSLDILDNVIPYIEGEEAKLEQEPKKILGKFGPDGIIPAEIKISAQCNRVPVISGHTESVSIKLKTKAKAEEVIEAWQTFGEHLEEMKLPFMPHHPIRYYSEPNYPQPRLHRNLERGMTVSVGRLRPCPLLDYKFTVLSHNTVRGAAGGAILNAEIMVKLGHIFW